jgi:hypothetical protein
MLRITPLMSLLNLNQYHYTQTKMEKLEKWCNTYMILFNINYYQ